MAAAHRHARALVLLGWTVVMVPGGIGDVVVAAPTERGQTVLAITVLAALVTALAGYRVRWLGPATVLLGVLMAATDPFEAGSLAWHITTVLADLVLAGLGLHIWLVRRQER